MATSVGGDKSRTSHEGLADVAEVVEERPRTGEEHTDATSRHFDAGGNFDQSHPPRTGVTFTKWFPVATAHQSGATVLGIDRRLGWTLTRQPLEDSQGSVR